MAIEVKRREGENLNSLLYRFQKKVKQSGLLKEARARRFHKRNINRIKRLSSALYRLKKKKEIDWEKKLGHA